MQRVFHSKLLLPSAAGCLPRPRLTEGGAPPRVLVAQAPIGAGKSIFLAQWLPALGIPFVFYGLSEQDRDGETFAAHVCAGFERLWPDWHPPVTAARDPQELAGDLASEAAARPPGLLALDGLEAAFGQSWLADFLAVLVRYAPPGLHLALSTRAPLPVEPGPDCRYLRAADLAFTCDEAEALLGPDDWAECWSASGGLPLALETWRQHGAGWRGALTAQVLDGLPAYMPAEIARALVSEWLSGDLNLGEFSHQVAVGQPGAEQLWREVRDLHILYADHPPAARERADALWETAHGRGKRPLMAAVAMVQGEICMAMGDYSLASDWYRQAFEIDPLLELTGAHTKTLLLRDQARMDEAEALALRCLEARAGRGDLVAQAMGHLTYGMICMERGRLDEAETHLREAEKFYTKYSANAPIYLTALCQRGLVEAARGNAPAFRRLAEEAHAMARGRFRFLEACTGMVLGAALTMWGDDTTAERLLTSAHTYLSSIGSKYLLHILLTFFSRKAWAEGKLEEARQHFDEALALAASEGYVQHLQAPRTGALPLIADALARDVETPFCQELLARMGASALPALVEMTRSAEPHVRRAALYPLAAIGGEKVTAAIRPLLHDTDQSVRDGALLAYQGLVHGGRPAPAGPVTVPAEPVTVQAASAARLSAAILGAMTVTMEGQPLPRWRTVKTRDLLAYFLLVGDRPITRDRVMEALWPLAKPESARALLHTTLYHLRGALGAVGEGLVTFAGGAYQFNRTVMEVDLTRFEQLAGSPDEASWRAAVTLYRGDLLEGLDYEWCEGPRTHARRLYQTTLRRLSEHLRDAGRNAEALEFLQLLIQVEPLDEEAHLGLMETYAALGNRSAALQQYRTITRLLADELGLDPGPHIQALYKQLLD